MKIFEVLKKLDEQKKYYESLGMLTEAATVEETKNHLTKYIHTEVVSKKEVQKEWDGGGSNISDFIEKIINLLSQVAVLPKEEIEQTFNVQNLKTIYYLIHNSNLEMNRIIDGMKSSQIGQLVKYTDKLNVSKNTLDVNMDLYSLLKNILLYENGEWVKPLSAFYDDFENRSIKIESLTNIKPNENLFDVFENTQLPKELILKLATVTGSQTPNRGNFETLFALLCKNGKFKVTSKGYENKEKGDIIIDNKGIELKVDMGKGGGRIGGQNGYNSVETIKKEYKRGMKNFCKFINDTFRNQIPTDNLQLAQKYSEVIDNYSTGKPDLNLNRNKNAKNIKLIDTAVSEMCSIIISIIGSFDESSNKVIMEKIIDFYKSIWCHFAGNDEVNARIGNLIETYMIGRSVENIIQEGSIIPANKFDEFSQMACMQLFAYYAELEPFDYIFIISTNEKELTAGKARMLSLSNEQVKTLATSNYSEVIKTGLYFKDLPTVYGKNAARAVKPMIGLV